MNNKDRIIAYICESIDEKERAEFESELKTSDSLRTEYEEIKTRLNSFKELGNIQINEFYFNNLLPRLRSRLLVNTESKTNFEWSKSLSLAFVSLCTILFILQFTTSFNIRQSSLLDNNFTEIFSEVPDSDLIKRGDMYTYMYSDYEGGEQSESAEFDEMMINDYQQYIKVNANYLTGSMEYNITDEEITQLYQSLLKKKIL